MPRSGIIRAGRLLELEAVAAVARQRSFRKAALDLGLSTTALSRTIAGVEERLGVQLFARTTRSVALTPAGERFVARMMPALREIGAAIDDATDQRDAPGGTLRINCSSGAARQILEPLILPFLERYPAVAIDLVTEGRFVDIVAQGFDAGIRQARSVPTGMASVPISGPVRFMVVASPAYLVGRRAPRVPADLLDHRCIRIQLANGASYPWEFRDEARDFAIDVPGTLTLDDPGLMRHAALAGAGFAYVAEWRVAADVAAGRLIPLLERWTPVEEGLYLYHPSRRHPSAALRALIEVVTES
ncbi:LysR family transcriptional regulator [Sphingomonas oryzagri]|uniref:LysR family transcriptional regulator n=1 Tax=Sphingomonas oryzagri TaxID=3042314 RepID=A0ABT6N062_9SPHN|nr:LysR family transcriptional regulator [Sphingomonas oryzagri]MDH7638119.1 LysR family transcriptional regulator [Sphingomonas oryzagri]